jgi:hypothetical protein
MKEEAIGLVEAVENATRLRWEIGRQPYTS